MYLFTRQGRTLLLSAVVAAAASIFTSGAFAQDTDAGMDTAYVPFLVNVDAAVKAEPGEGAVFDAPVQISVKGGAESFIRIPVQKTISVLYGAQKHANRFVTVSSRGGKVTLNLPAQSYKNAVVALYTVDGKRVLRKTVSASNAANNISRRGLANGAYILSVKGTGRDAITSRLTHSGGSLDINVTFGGDNRLSSAEKLAKKAAAENWTITVSAAGHFDSSYTINPKAGMNATQTITLREAPVDGHEVIVSSAGTGSTGGGSYTVGTTVNITAGTPPEGQQFKNWTSTDSDIIFADANSAVTKFLMPPKAVTVTANFEAASATAPTYAVAIVAGMGSTGAGNYAAGATVSITAGTPAEGQQFKNWMSSSSDVTFANANSAATTFTMPENAVAVVAVFEAIPTATPTEYAVTVSSTGTGATGGGNYASGANVIINAGTAPSGYVFEKWTSSTTGITFADEYNATTVFIMPANAVTVTATFVLIKYTVMVSSVGAGAGGGGDYVPGMAVNITAGTAPTGMVFKNWTSTGNGVTLANANSAATTFTMPANAATVTANFVTGFVDARDGKIYRTTTIDGVRWMAENLNNNVNGSWCYGDDNSNCAKYGRLYDWNTANTICPTGWHLPSRDEWGSLAIYAGGTGSRGEGGEVAGTKLKATSGWNDNGNGTDDYEFSALPGGNRGHTNGFGQGGNIGYWWTTDKAGTGDNFHIRMMTYAFKDVSVQSKHKDDGLSVRCVEGVRYNVTVSSSGTGASGSGGYATGAKVNINAGTPPAGMQFKNWTSSNTSVTFSEARASVTTFTMPSAAVTVTANFEVAPVATPTYAVTVSSIGEDASGKGDYAAGAAVGINAGLPPAGMQFKNWTTASSGVTLANANSATTSFTMPANAVTVTANFETKKYTVTVSRSEGTGATGGGSYASGATVSINAGTVAAGYVFKNWTSSIGGITFANANSAATTFIMPAGSVAVTANIVAGFVDARDSKIYKTVTIGGKKWMAENLNYLPSKGNSWCYGNDANNCAKYGRLYDWSTAKAACPTGWKLPSRAEWGNLAKAAGGTGNYGAGGTAGKALKSTSGWNSGNGTDSYGFSALPGGERWRGSFGDAGSYGYWWTATERGYDASEVLLCVGSYGLYCALREDRAYYRGINISSDNVVENSDGKDVNDGISVRCIEN